MEQPTPGIELLNLLTISEYDVCRRQIVKGLKPVPTQKELKYYNGHRPIT